MQHLRESPATELFNIECAPRLGINRSRDCTHDVTRSLTHKCIVCSYIVPASIRKLPPWPNNAEDVMEKLLRLPEVKDLTCRSTSRIYADMAAGTFPKPVRIGVRAVAWRESELQEWLEKRIKDREAA
jgi:prophage regulatory protein